MDPFIHHYLGWLLVAIAVGGGIAVFDYAYFMLLPRLAAARLRESDPERLRRYLERVVATPSLFGAGQKLVARLLLAGVYFQKGQHAEVVCQCRACLDSLPGVLVYLGSFRSLEANFRYRLADSLEALGQRDEADAERRRATALVDEVQPEVLRCLTRGKLLERQNRYAEAYAAYLRALDRMPALWVHKRIECLMHLAFAGNNAGLPADSLRWAEEVLALVLRGSVLLRAHRVAAVACTSLSRPDDAEGHIRLALDLAAAENDRPATAELRAELAGCLGRQGRLAAAIDACVEAVALDPKAERAALAVQAQVFHARGRWDDALAAIQRYRECRPLTVPHLERRVRALCSLDAARIAAECGRGDDAWRHIQDALAELGTDAKLGFKCEAVLATVHAVRGDADESRRLAASLETRLVEFQQDPGTRCSVLYDLGMAAAARGDHPAGVRCWNAYLALHPDSVYRPVALYHRGECFRLLGLLDDACADYGAAVDMDIDCHFAGLARRRLEESAR